MLVFSVQSTMSKKDWRKFLTAAVLRRNPKVMLIINVLALGAAFLLSWDSVEGFNFVKMSMLFPVLWAAQVGAVLWMSIRANLNRIGQDQSTFELPSTFNFYEEKIGIKAPGVKQQSKVPYSSFWACLESRDFIIFYVTPEEGIALCKRDAEDLEGLRTFLKEKFGERFGKM